MPQPFQRTPHTWLLYLIFAVFGYVINALGPATPFLKAELGLSYTVSSLVFSAFAAGVILTGLVAHVLAAHLERGRLIWLGLFGMSLGMVAMAAVPSAWMVIGASFLTGCTGALLPGMVPSSLADEHGDQRGVAFSENNLIAAISSAVAPLMVGWFSYSLLGWRVALVLPLVAALGLRLVLGRRVQLAEPAQAAAGAVAGRRLPGIYWVLWGAMLLAVAVEYCMLAWSADYLENVAGLPRAVAAQSVSIFLGGLILGRAAGSRMVRRFSDTQVVTASILIAAAGFGLYWSAAEPWLIIVGLFLTGLGVANQFPLILSMAVGASGGNTVQASTRSSLGSGIAIFVLPLVLGRLADGVGIRLAYGLVAVLLAAAFAIIQVTVRRSRVAAAEA